MWDTSKDYRLLVGEMAVELFLRTMMAPISKVIGRKRKLWKTPKK